MKTKNKFLLFALIGICFSACSNNKDKNGKELSTTTTGEVKIAADETLLSIIDAQEQVFETIYQIPLFFQLDTFDICLHLDTNVISLIQ